MTDVIEITNEAASPANACMALEGKVLEGLKLGGSWAVKQRIEKKEGSTGGTFSVGYIVEDQNGNEAFMKATDIGLLTKAQGNILQNITQASYEQKFEREILDVLPRQQYG